MLYAVKQKLKTILTKFCVAFTICVCIGLPLGAAGIKAAGIRGDIEFPSIVIGGGTEEHAAREQQIAALSAALPAAVITPVKAVERSI